MNLDLRQLTFYSLVAWLGTGCLLMAAASLQIMSRPAFAVLGLPFILLLLIGIRVVRLILKISLSEHLQVMVLMAIWVLHATGLMVPETGFDAVWYHLPVAKAMIEASGFVYLPVIYQSLNPLFSDLLFIAGYGIYGELGAKIVAYAVAGTLMLVTYQLARLQLTRYWSLWVVLTVSTFQVVSWQASSFYVDLAKALWEIGGLWLILKPGLLPKTWQLLISGMTLGATVGTKAFSWLLLPVFLIILLAKEKMSRTTSTVIFMLGVGVLSVIFYIRPWIVAGDPFLSINLHLGKLAEIGGDASLLSYVWQRIYSLPKSLFDLTFMVRDFVSLILLVLLPLVLWQAKTLLKDETARLLLLFGVSQYVLWWFLPPLSTRYAISGFIVLTILWMKAVMVIVNQDRRYYLPLTAVLILAVQINIAPRAIVAQRNVRYVTQQQTKSEYLNQFFDGSIDQHLKLWHGLK